MRVTERAINLRKRLPNQLRRALRNLHFLLHRIYLPLAAWLLAWIEKGMRRAENREKIPPPILRYRVGESFSISNFQQVGRQSALNLQAVLDSCDFVLSPGSKVLDFGCGCGRTLLWLRKQWPDVRLFGTDNDAASIEWCQENLPAATFKVNGANPPLSYQERTFDLVYSISVFTHLLPEMQPRWWEEFNRIVRPGGMVIFPIFGKESTGHLDSHELLRLESLGVLAKSSRKLSTLFPEWYQTVFHSPEFVQKELSRRFVDVLHLKGAMGIQDAIVCRHTKPMFSA